MDHPFDEFARYNQWANGRLYESAFALADADYRRDVGVFFRSLHGTLNHLLLTDRIWMRRMTGTGDHPGRLNAIIHDDLSDLALARADEDERIIAFVAGLDPQAPDATVEYATLNGRQFSQPLGAILSHLFNHQTHHRGQAHAALTICGCGEPPPLDLLAMQRGLPSPDLRMLAQAATGER